MANDTGLEANKLYKVGDSLVRGSTIINSDHPYRAVDGCYDGDPSEYVVPYEKDQATGKWIVPIPTFTGELTYNGFWYTPTFNNFDAKYMFIDGKQSAKDPGTYTVTFTLANTDKFMWADRDESHSDRNVTWSIGRATGYISVSADDITFNDRYGQTQISYEAHTSNLEFVSSNPSISATCSNGIIFIKATEAKNGDYTLTVIAPQTATHTEARLVIDVHVVFTNIGSDLYLTERTVAYGDQQLQRRWSRINQSIDEICSEVGYQNQQLGNTINSLSRVKINADESKSEIELLCHYDKNGEGADAIIRLRAITDTMAGAIKAHSQIYMAADWIRMEGYTTINGAFQIADSSSYFQTLGYQPGDVFLENAYIGSPTNVFAHIGYDSSSAKYGFFSDYFKLQYGQYAVGSYSYYGGKFDLSAYGMLHFGGWNSDWQANANVELSSYGLEFTDSKADDYRFRHSIGIFHARDADTSGGYPNAGGWFLQSATAFTGNVSIASSRISIVDNNHQYMSATGDWCNGVRFSIVKAPIQSSSGTYPPQLYMSCTYTDPHKALDVGGYTMSNKPSYFPYFDDISDNSVGVWQPGRLVVGFAGDFSGSTIPKDSNNQAYKLTVEGRIYATSNIYSNGQVVSSDRSIKYDIEDLDSRYIDLFDRLEVKRFKKFSDTDRRYQLGFIAQDVEYAADMSGLDWSEQGFAGKTYDLHFLDYSQLSVLTAFKLKEIEKDYKNRISTLEAKIDTLLREKGE